ncbi:MAG: modification methylase, partial [Gammaproteobacteria bacterium]|nr:modification methylase [Gammaproteobacteria bacterium]
WMGDFIKDYSELKVLRNKSLSSHLNKKYQENRSNNTYVDFFVNEVEKNDPWSKKIPLMIDSYFNDMDKVLRNIYNYSMKNNYCVIVVGNSSYANIAIPTDQILADIGLNIGFSSAEVVVARKLGTSSQQYKRVNNVNVLRESLVILKK